MCRVFLETDHRIFQKICMKLKDNNKKVTKLDFLGKSGSSNNKLPSKFEKNVILEIFEVKVGSDGSGSHFLIIQTKYFSKITFN